MLQILHKNGVSRKRIKIIMDDLQKSGIFDDEEVVDEVDYEIDWNEVDEENSMWILNLGNEIKLDAIRNMNNEEKNDEFAQKRNQFFYDNEKRIQAKMKEMEEKGLIGLKDEDESDIGVEEEVVIKKEQKQVSLTRYGRNPLHEAVAMRDIRLVKKYAQEGLYLDGVDNNGHTPMEMAYYEGYKEAMIIFDAL